MKRTSVFLLLAIMIVLSSCSHGMNSEKLPEAVNGVLDLSHWDFENKAVLELKGEWEFYWNNFYDNEDFYDGSKIEKTGNIIIPGVWNGYEVDGEKLSGHGYGTYRLHVLLNPSIETISLKVLTMQTAGNIFLNGEKVISAGTPGVDSHTAIPAYKPQIIVYTPDRDYVDIVIHVSNYDHRMGGIWGTLLLGTEQGIKTLWMYSRDRNFIFLGAIFVMGLYHLGLFFIRRRSREALYFSIFCFVIALRVGATADIFLLDIFPEIPWKLLVFLEYLTFFIAVPMFLLFIQSIFKDKILRSLSKIVMGFSILFSIITLVAPVNVSSRLIPLFQVMTVIAGFYTIIVLVRHCLKKDIQAGLILAGFLIMFLGSINDILYAANIISSFYTISYGILIFIFFQAVVMTIRFSNSFTEVDRQRRQLLITNQEYLKEIDERTRLEADLLLSMENNAKIRLAIIVGLAKLAEYRDSDTGEHIERIQEFITLLARQLKEHPKYRDYISDEYIEDLHVSSILHDIGKVGIPDNILLKPGKLTAEEFEKMKEHSRIGGDAIRAVEKKTGIRSFLTLAKEIAYMHHEKWDGSGYPFGLKAEEIPLSARLTALVDVYDALTSKRCYKDAMSHEKTVDIILKGKGSHFDPDVVGAFLAIHESFDATREALQD
ncbi:HD domain-containing phosphohydrolase [Oceanispirochaeta crateris]|nr:7TM diverse intracellular signaling domain-containing protein [Oceanispirochaeta crateris]